MNPISGLAEAHLDVSDLDASVAFYERLGFSLAWRDDDVAFVRVPSSTDWLGLWAIPKPENHVAFAVSYEDVQDAKSWLGERDVDVPESEGIEEPYVRPHQGNASLYFEDPDGNSLEFLAQLPEGMDEEREEKVPVAEWEGRNRNRNRSQYRNRADDDPE